MATTYLKKHKISKGETIAKSLKDRFEYGQNPDKTQGGELISSYACDHITADAEFHWAVTGRAQRWDADVLSIRSGRRSRLERSPRRKPIESATKQRCAGRRASMPFSLPPTQTASISTTTFTTIPLCWIAPGSSGISSARPALCGGFLTECVWKMACP